MSEHEPQDGSKVKGYRKLTDDDIAQMNLFKALSHDFCEKLDVEIVHINLAIAERGDHEEEDETEAMRCLAIAREKMQEACMWACRAVARPDADC